ncbi:unnamed protein product [Thelazia callipaeda]|uniref:C2 domain-containing protein n=1 Tax=Thelazia callipaeda TaxID=103827 RepID=A0A0N5CZA2_THECL|nr:unnamed protein product [Thelazia callipaeda]
MYYYFLEKIMQIFLSILLLVFWISINYALLDSSGTIFWLSSKVEKIEWRKGCLTTAGCAQPRFQLLLLNVVTNEKLSKSWLISPQLMQERQRSYVTHWSDGNPSDIEVTCEVVGVDPTYGFPRICDASLSVNIYQNKEKEEIRKSFDMQTFGVDGSITVQLAARCFNSTMTIEKHEEHCPWCMEYSDDTVINQQYPEDSKSTFSQFIGNETHLNILVITFALTTAISSAFCAFTLYLYARQKKTTDSPCIKCQPCRERELDSAHVHIESPTENSKYDAPWDRRYRPLPRWTSSRSNSSGASPPDTSSTFTTSSQHLKPTKVIIGNHTNSSSSSIYEKPENRSSLRCV